MLATRLASLTKHKSLLKHVAQEQSVGTTVVTFASLTTAQQDAVRIDTEERYFSFIFLRQSGAQHTKLKVDLQNDFTTGDNHYLKTRQQTLHLLNKYSKTAVTTTTNSEGASFAQRGGSGARKKKAPFDKAYWKGKTYFKCNEKYHPSSHCPKANKTVKADTADKADKEGDASSTASSVNKLKKQIKKMSKVFTTVSAKLEQLKEAESDLSATDTEEEACHFQYDDAFQFAQLESKSVPRISKLFKQSQVAKITLDLEQVILLDSQSTMDLFCNRALVDKTYKSRDSMQLKTNAGTMLVSQKATIPGYNKKVWFSTRAITNIVALSNLIQQYRITYYSNDLTFVVHCEPDKSNMEFRMHKSGLHYYDPRTRKNERLSFVNTVAKNKSSFSKRQIKGAEVARTMKDFKWIIRSHHIKDSPVTVQDVEVAISIWGKNISALTGKTTRKKSSLVARDYVKVSTELLKLHKEVFLTADILCE
jgi:hypothetical protein